MTSVLRLVAIAAATLFAGATQATTTVHTDSATFLDALVGGAYTETFNGLTNGPDAAAPFAFSGLGFSYEISASSGVFTAGRDVGTNQPDEALTITFTGRPVSAVGGNFYTTSYQGTFMPDRVYIELSDGTAGFYTPLVKSSFLGFTSTVAITSLTLYPAGVVFGNYAAVDNLTVGVSPVPEPGQWALMALGLVGLGALARRRAA